MFNILKPTAMRRMLIARERVAKRNPFFASILFGANIIESKKHQTVWTNGIDIFYNPDFVEDGEADKFLEGILLKTVLHCAMLHVSRRRYRQEERWNQSCSFPANKVVEDYFKLPEDALRDDKFSKLSPEAVYELLQQQEEKQEKQKQKQKGKGQGQGQPEDGDGDGEGEGEGQEGEQEKPGSMFSDETSEQEQEQGERQWKNSVAGAIEKSPPGTMPGNLQRLIQDLFPKEKIDWKDLIRDMSRDAKSNTTRVWTRPNRRRLGNDEYFPGNGNDKVFKLVMCLDVSGSVSQQMIQEMCEEAASLLDQNLINHVTLISVDTRIQNTLEAKSSEDLKGWNAGGGGGTNFDTAMKTVGEMSDVIGCIFLTDMMTSSFGPQPEFPVVWVDWANSGAKAPYGRTVSYK
jgi:predicted metal-dependent peptidase